MARGTMKTEKQAPKQNREDKLSEQEELDLLKRKFHSMTMRGHYKECFKLVEDNISMLYTGERWPESFYGVLKTHRRCFASMGIRQPYDEYLTTLLKKHGIPVIFVQLLKEPEGGIRWKADFFREKVLELRGEGQYEDAASWCELLLKTEPANSNGYLLKGWIYSDMGRTEEADQAYRDALERHGGNYQAWASLAELYVEKAPKKALEYLGNAVSYAPGEPQYMALKGKIHLSMGDRASALECYTQAGDADPMNPEYMYQKGEIMLLDGQDLAAMRFYSQAVAHDSKHLPSLRRLAGLLAPRQPEQAIPFANNICAQEPQNLEAALLRADLYRRVGDTGSAVRYYRQVLELDEKCARAWAALGDMSLAESPSTALQCYDRAGVLEPSQATHFYGKARALEALERPEDAIEAYKKTVELDSKNPRAWGALGMLHVESAPKEACGYLDKAIALDGKNAWYYQNKAEAMQKMPGHIQEVLDLYNTAVKYDPGNAELRLYLARFLEQTDKIASAVENYKIAVSLNPNLAAAYHGLARLTMHSEPDMAVLYINRAIDLDATRGEFYFVKALILDVLGDRGQSLEHLQEALYSSDDSEEISPEMMEEVGQIMGGESPRVALLYINRAIELAPHTSLYHCTRANLLHRLGSVQQALGEYQQALKLDPGNHEAHYGIGVILADRKDPKALDSLEKAVRLAPQIAKYHALKGTCLSREESSWREAVAAFDEALKIDNQMWEILLHKAELYDEHGNEVEAMANYRRVLLVNRDCLTATARMGELLARHGAFCGLGYLEHAIRLDPENSLHHVWKARILMMMGRQEEAEEECALATQLGEKNHEVHYTLAVALAGKLSSLALTCIEEAMALQPGRAEYHMLRGDILFRLDRLEEAKREYARTLELSPNSHEAVANTAEILYRQQKEESLEVIDRALEMSPDNPKYLLIRSKILCDLMGRMQEALDCINLAVRMAPDSVPCRELLVELLGRKKARIKLILERKKLEKCRRLADEYEEIFRTAGAMPEAAPEVELPAEEADAHGDGYVTPPPVSPVEEEAPEAPGEPEEAPPEQEAPPSLPPEEVKTEE